MLIFDPRWLPNGPKGQFLSQIKEITRTYMQRHTMTEMVNHSRSTALELSVENLTGEGVGWGGLHQF